MCGRPYIYRAFFIEASCVTMVLPFCGISFCLGSDAVKKLAVDIIHDIDEAAGFCIDL